MPLTERLKSAFLKPVDPAVAAAAAAEGPKPLDELELEAKYTNDRERIVGLFAAPIAAAIGLLITGADINNDPAAPSKLHVNVSLYDELRLVLVVLAVVMLIMAMRRKRLYLGMVMALYGLTVFNLHYWGFGVPFILFASWYLVRAYRLQRELKEATATAGGGAGGPRPSKRYTPPTARPKRLPRAESD